MKTASPSAARRLLAVAILVGLLFGATACTGSADGGTTAERTGSADHRGESGHPSRDVTVVGEAVVARAVDRARGLQFEVESSTTYGDTALRVTLLDGAPAETQRLVKTQPMAATCDIPERDVAEFAGYWDERFDQFGTTLIFDATSRPGAYLVTSCELRVGVSGSNAESATFPAGAFSTVRFR